MLRFKNFIEKHLCFKMHSVTWICLAVVMLTIPGCMYLPEKYAYENSLLENIQLLILICGVFFALTAKYSKSFFKFAALVLGILFLREINCGRTVFFPVPNQPNCFYSCKDIKYGWLAHPLYGIYMAWTGIYFFWKRLYIDFFKYVKNIKFPVWNCLFLLIGMVIGWLSEHKLDNMMLEEMAEMLFYVALVGIIYLYSQKEEFNITK